MTVFETTRLSVRPLQINDLPGFCELQTNPRVMEYTSQEAMTEADCEEDLKRVIGYYTKPGNDFWVWAIDRKSDGAFIGTCAIIKNVEHENDIGYRLIEKYWGMGYATEIAGELINYAFGTMGLYDLIGTADVRNTASLKVIEKYMTFEKEFYNEDLRCTDRQYRIINPNLSFTH